ncbi:MAG TPA: FtsK/SpoIIIE domain-containing protein [Pseudonocardia sp.]
MASIFSGGRRRRIRAAYEALCDAMAAADGVSSAAAENVRRRHLDALVELWLREEGIDGAAADPEIRGLLTNPEFAQVVRAVEADRSANARRPADVLPKLDRIVADATPGSAGRAEDWLGKHGEHKGVVDVPQLWRIGTGRLGPVGAPFEVALPLLDESHLQISSHPQGRAAALGVVENLLMRVVSHFRPGLVALHLWDFEHLTGPLPRLHPLSRSGILHVHDPAGLPQLLDELSDRIRRVHRDVLAKGETTLAGLTGTEGTRTEPWVVAVLVGNRQALREEEHRALGRIARGGLACGVQLVLLDVPMAIGAPVETLDIDDKGMAVTSMTGRYVQVKPEDRFAEGPVGAGCYAIAAEHDSWRSRIATFDELLAPPDARWAVSSKTGLTAPVGFDDAGKVEIVLDDSSPHALVGGPSGSGKTNLLLAWIGALTTRYSPDELELYLLDFKEGVSFAQFAPGRHDTTWLPHAQLIGINVNDDREFGLALLQFLSDEMRRRAAEAKRHEVTKLEDLRDADEDGRWPRIVAVIDEFQYLFAEQDSLSKAALMLMEDIARRGRSQGIHLVLASQDVSGIAAFWGRPAIFEQFVLRIALPRARRVLDEKTNEASLDLPRWHAVLNHESGLRHGNQIARIPNSSTRHLFDEVQSDMLEKWAHRTQPHLFDDAGDLRLEQWPEQARPRLFDGSRSPRLDDLLGDIGPGQRRAPVGQSIDLYASAAIAELPDAPGRNLAVLGAGADAAVRTLATAAAGLVKGYEPGTVEVVLGVLVEEAEKPAARLKEWLKRAGHDTNVDVVALQGIKERVETLAERTRARVAAGERGRTVVVLFGADAADSVLDRSGTEAMRALVHFGPETGLHVLGWWRSAPRLKALLTMGAVVDDVGAWVALDVQGTELQMLLPGTLLTWSPRAGRALFFDRLQHSQPHVVVVSGESPGVPEETS